MQLHNKYFSTDRGAIWFALFRGVSFLFFFFFVVWERINCVKLDLLHLFSFNATYYFQRLTFLPLSCAFQISTLRAVTSVKSVLSTYIKSKFWTIAVFQECQESSIYLKKKKLHPYIWMWVLYIITASDTSTELRSTNIILSYYYWLGGYEGKPLNLKTMTFLWGHQLNFMTYVMKYWSQTRARITFSPFRL